MVLTTVDWILHNFIFTQFKEKEKIYYSCPRIINNLINSGKIRVNNTVIKSLFQEVAEGDSIYFNGKEHCFHKNDLLFAWLSKQQSRL